MTSDTSTNGGGWQAIRPWSTPLTLDTREVTSVSVTFILSSHLSDRNDDHLDLILADDTEDGTHTEGSSTSAVLEPRKKSIISDALAKGLSVNVNGSPWHRVFIRVDEGSDEAVIIIYGLMPGRQYDVDLGLVQGDSNSKIQRQVVTEDADLDQHLQGDYTDPDSPSFSHSTSSDPAQSTPSTSPSHTHPNTPPPSNLPLTVEDRLSQLEHTLSVLNAERETLSTSLKSARRDAQKADASLRSEIEILKRASEKHVAAEQRSKQKILSLQEALKRAQTATRETEELTKEVQQLVPELKKQQKEKEAEYAKVKEEADNVRREKDKVLDKEKKKIEAMKVELAGLTNKVEKLNAKREKLETTILADLEAQLKETELEITKVVQESPVLAQQDLTLEDLTLAESDPRSPAYPYLASQRVSPGVIARPSPVIQRPQTIDRQLPPFTPPWNLNAPRQQPPARHTPSQSLSQPPSHSQHNPRSSSLHFSHPPVLLTNPHRQSSLKSSNRATHSPTTAPSTSSPTASLPASISAPQITPTSTSTLPISSLSSRALPFEPGRLLKSSTSSSHSSDSPMQRSSGPGPGIIGSGTSRIAASSGQNTSFRKL